ncbi:MAG: GNAT family N-acetyltransferase [Clostridium sp.]
MNGTSKSEYVNLQVKLPKGILIRQFIETDYPLIKNLYEREGWMTFINREHDAFQAWKNSTITLVAMDGNNVVGLVRGLSDGKITTYIAEIIVDINYRGKGIGKALLEECHNLHPSTRFDLLSSEGADQFYKNNKFRTITGFRKSY